MNVGNSEQPIRLKDGRRLGYAEYGDRQGTPLFYFNGTPGSRIEARTADGIAGRLGIRLIGTDRPGYGLSDFKEGRTFLDWPDDVLELAQALRIGRFGVLGFSGGGPHVAACALRIPERLTVAAIVSCSLLHDSPEGVDGIRQRRLIHGISSRAPVLGWLAWRAIAMAARRFPRLMISRMGGMMSEPDRAVLSRDDVRALFIDDFAEAFRQGARGAAWDMALVGRPWGFQRRDIGREIHLWHGEEDTNAGRVASREIPNCRATFLPGEGHLLFWNHTEAILHRLAELMAVPARVSRG